MHVGSRDITLAPGRAHHAMTTQSISQATDRPPFEVIPFAGDLWKVLDWSLGRYIRGFHNFASARRFASARNRKAGFLSSAVIRNRPLCDGCASTPCVCVRRRTRAEVPR